MFGMGLPEILMILAIALVVVGPRKLPDLGRGLGKAMREFRKATSEFKSSLNIEDDLGEVRRSFNEMNSDLKSTLSTAAFKEKKDQPETPPRPEDAATSGRTPSPPAADETRASGDAAAEGPVPPNREDGDARS